MRGPAEGDPPLLRVYRGFLSRWMRETRPGEIPSMRSVGAGPGALFCLVWLGLLTWGIASSLKDRGDMLAELRLTPEYRCLVAADRRAPRVSWTVVHVLAEPRTGARAATLRDRRGLNCIPDGDAVTYVEIEFSRGEFPAQWLRLRGDKVEMIYRGEDWAELANADGSQRYRHDGQGYRLVVPR